MSETSVNPRSLTASEEASKKTLAHFVLTLRNEVGTLELVSGLTARNNVNILSGFHEASAGSESSWSFFADVTNAKVSADELAVQLRRVSMVLDVKFRGTHVGFIADSFHFPTRLGKRSLVMLSADSMAAVFGHMKEMLGANPAAVVIHQMGFSNGKEMYSGFELRFGKGASRELLEEFLHLIRAAGWGCETLKELDMENSIARVELAQCAECTYYQPATTPQSQFVKGTYAGFFSGVFGQRVNAEEVRCIAKGDNVCEFVLRPA